MAGYPAPPAAFGRVHAGAQVVCGAIGRMTKVSEEDLVALLAAVERFVRLDRKARWRVLSG